MSADPPIDPEAVAAIACRLRAARRVLAITGAGMSAASGLPTYRGSGGLYDRDRTPEGYAIEDALSIDMLNARPEICWRHLAEIEQACRGAAPNRGHTILADFERRFEHFVVLTQNVDGLHQSAGSCNVIPIHGDVHHLVCTRCSARTFHADYSALPIPPYCKCGGLIRPDVVLFGERLPPTELARLEREIALGFDVALSIGTTSVFSYITYPVYATRRRGGFTVEINPGQTSVSDGVDVRLRCGAVEALEAIVRELDSAR